MPDATGLELIAHELRERFDGSVAGTDYYRDIATVVAEPDQVLDVLRWLRDDPAQQLQLPRQRARLPTTCRPSRASASTTSCSTWSGSSACT